jgi:spermidine synthase
MRKAATCETSFQKLEVWTSENEVEFRVEGAVHAWRHDKRYLSGLAWDNIAAACLLRPDGPPESVLMLGLAGGTSLRILRRLLPECRFTAVEIDAQIVDLAREWTHLDEIGVEVVVADAYQWLRRNRRRFDAVIDDIYLAGADDVFRPVAWEARHLDSLQKAVAPGGLLAANLVTGVGHRTMQMRFRRLFRDRFPVVRSVTTPASLNETLVGGQEVSSGRCLSKWRFPNATDRRRWNKIKVRKL